MKNKELFEVLTDHMDNYSSAFSSLNNSDNNVLLEELLTWILKGDDSELRNSKIRRLGLLLSYVQDQGEILGSYRAYDAGRKYNNVVLHRNGKGVKSMLERYMMDSE